MNQSLAFKLASAALSSLAVLRCHSFLKTFMSDFLELGPCPYDENCEQVGKDYDPARARLECRVLRDQLVRQFGPPPEGACYRTRSNPHDFGTYYDLAIYYDEQDEKAMIYAFKVERESAVLGQGSLRSFRPCPERRGSFLRLADLVFLNLNRKEEP